MLLPQLAHKLDKLNKLVAIFSEQKKLYVYVHFCLNFKDSILWR